jgi:predicted phage-related endonuclease
MAGKLTDDRAMSASRLPGLLGFSKYSTPNDELQFSINAIDGKERPDIGNEAMGWGNTLEPVILSEAAKRLGITKFDTDIRKAFTHDAIPLSCSLDGTGEGEGQTITHDPSKGIYVVGAESIVLNGTGVLEAKLTKTNPEDTPHLARGPIQLQGQMLVTGYRWGAVCVLYGGIELRVFLFDIHYETQQRIVASVLEFDNKLVKYTRTKEIDWYPPESSKEVDRFYPYAKKEEVELDGNALELAQAIVHNKTLIRKAEAEIDSAETQIKMKLGNAERGKAGSFHISWPMRSYKASPEKITPAREAYSIRQSSLSIKEWTT